MVMRRHRWHTTLSFLLAGLLSVAPAIQATATNRTIDDQDGDSATGAIPQYAPSTGWNKGQQCTGCFVQLDVNQVFHGTWMDGTVPRDGTDPWTITLNFVGTAIYVFNAVANSVTNARTDQNMTFVLDGQNVGEFVHPATSSTEIDYRVQVFSRNGLTNGSHTLVIQPQPNSNILFDFAMYTFEDADSNQGSSPSGVTTDGSGAPTTSDSTSSPTGLSNSTSGSSSSSVKTIVAAVVGTIAGIAVVAALIFFLRRRRRQTPSRSRVSLDADDEKGFATNVPPPHVPSLPPMSSRAMGSSASEGGSSVYTGMHRGAESATLASGWASQDASSVARFSIAGSSALSSPPPVSSKRAGASAGAAAATNSTLHAELAALRQEVAQLRQDRSSSTPTPSAPLPTPTWPSARSEKSTYTPTVLSPTSAQEETELARLREEIVRLRGEEGNVRVPVDEAPPLYPGMGIVGTGLKTQRSVSQGDLHIRVMRPEAYDRFMWNLWYHLAVTIKMFV
ncbi:hypothetical protein C8Q80DRAFT_1341245 [Daedaleopsis nitida]|nr:hypothetical protein C8Q80DRAFT_1341245 [Daedaleopsis nitida]